MYLIRKFCRLLGIYLIHSLSQNYNASRPHCCDNYFLAEHPDLSDAEQIKRANNSFL
jgi:hypothetical protein